MLSKKKIIDFYISVSKIRKSEEKLIELNPEQEMRCPHHYAIGQEVVAAGVCINLNDKDQIFSSHRCHGHYIAKGGCLKSFMAELYNKVTGCTEGKGGSMHLIDTKKGMMGSHGVVGTNIPIALGASFYLKYKKKKNLSVVFFGDGGADQGVLYESLNFAALKKLPILFVCENNGFASFSHISSRHAQKNISLRVSNFGLKSFKLDGNNPVLFLNKIEKIINYIKKNNKPVFVEAKVNRFMAHCGQGEDIGPGLRSKNDLNKMRNSDPLVSLQKYLIKKKLLNKDRIKLIDEKIDLEIQAAVSYAKKSKLPSKKDLFKNVLA